MQAALTFAPNLVPSTPSRNISQVASFPPKVTASLTSKRDSPIKVATVSYDTSTVDYSSQRSVFPAEACETIGGEACMADVYPEVKLEPQSTNGKWLASTSLISTSGPLPQTVPFWHNIFWGSGPEVDIKGVDASHFPRNDPPRTENVEREYLEYDDAKTVFQGEACDDLGGIFCDREYQKGIY